MLTRRFALIMGIIFTVVGILGFIPGITVMRHGNEGLAVTGPGHGYLFGLFHVNLLHNLFHLVFGLWGIAASAHWLAARGYAQTVAIVYGLLVFMGLIPAGNTWNLWGLVPLHGNDVWLHAIIAGVAAYFGFAVFAEEADTRTPSDWNRPSAGV